VSAVGPTGQQDGDDGGDDDDDDDDDDHDRTAAHLHGNARLPNRHVKAVDGDGPRLAEDVRVLHLVARVGALCDVSMMMASS
jgi:hypothetical protein